MIRKSLVFVWCCFFAIFQSRGQQVQDPIIGESIDQSKIDLRWWVNTVLPRYLQISEPAPGQADKPVRFEWDSRIGGGNEYITINQYPPPYEIRDINANIYRGLVHELGHFYHPLNLNRIVDGSVEEGLAEAKKNLFYRRFNRLEDPSVQPATTLFIEDLLNNLPRDLLGGDRNNWIRIASTAYFSAAGPFELLINRSGGNFKRIDSIRNNHRLNRRQFLMALDGIAERVDGVLPSTFVGYTVSSYLNGPDGTFRALLPFTNPPGWHGSNTNANINPTYWQAINLWRKDGLLQSPLDGWIKYKIEDGAGKVWAEDTVEVGLTIPSPEFPKTDGWPKGAYKLTNWKADDENSRVVTYFVKLHDFQDFLERRDNWHRGAIYVITNGDQYENLQPESSFRVISDGGATVVKYNNLLVFQNPKTDVTVTNGRFTRTFTPDWDVSRVKLFTKFPQPLLQAVTNAASYEAGEVSPGSIYTFWTEGASFNDPEAPKALPLPTQGCRGNEINNQGVTRALFVDSSGKTFEAPSFYCDAWQFNLQVPQGLSTGGTVTAYVELNGVRSNGLLVEVTETDPAIFQIDPVNQLGAIVFAAGDKTGQLVTPDNPVRPGEALSVYATGLGAVNPPPEKDGMPPEAISYTVNRTLVTASGEPLEVLFSGLAPGFAGLYQVNFRLPKELQPGNKRLILIVNGRASNEVMLAVQ